RLGCFQIASLARLDQPVVILRRVFRVERQPQWHLTVARQFDRELDPLIAVWPHLDIARVLVGREDLLEDVAERHLAPGSPRFDIAEDTLQIAYAGISPTLSCTRVKDSLTILNDAPSRCSSVPWSFSSTVWRICSSFSAFSERRTSRRPSTVLRSASC